MLYSRVAILGLGLMGGSLGLALREKKAAQEVVGWTSLRREREPLPKPVRSLLKLAKTPQEAVSGADLVLLAAPVKAIPALAKRVQKEVSSQALVSDVASTKLFIHAQLEPLFPNFCGGHPLCGSEKQGIAFASPSLFEGAPYLLTPTKKGKPLQKFARALRALGAKPYLTTPKEHDEWLALTSHFPHLLAYTLCRIAARKDLPTLRHFLTPSFLELTRVAQSPPRLWSDILTTNSSQLKRVEKEFTSELKRTLAQCSEPQKLVPRLKRGQTLRKKL